MRPLPLPHFLLRCSRRGHITTVLSLLNRHHLDTPSAEKKGFVKMSKKLFVGNLAFAATEEDLEKAFGAFGDIEDAKIILDRETGRSRGFAFVTFYSKDAAEAALSLDGQDLAGRTMRVNFATEREGGSGGGGGGRGGRRGYGGGRR